MFNYNINKKVLVTLVLTISSLFSATISVMYISLSLAFAFMIYAVLNSFILAVLTVFVLKLELWREQDKAGIEV